MVPMSRCLSAILVLLSGCSGAGLCRDGGEARGDTLITWGIESAVCMFEVCEADRQAECTVSSIAGEGPIVLTLACDHQGLGAAEDVISIDLDPTAAIDLVVGAKVSLSYSSIGGFETGGWSLLRLTDDRGLVFASTSGVLSGGGSGNPDWGSDQVRAAVAPLSGSVANAGCLRDDARNFVTIGHNGASIEVGSGSSDVLVAGSSWLVIVEKATRRPGETDEEALDFTIMRLAP